MEVMSANVEYFDNGKNSAKGGRRKQSKPIRLPAEGGEVPNGGTQPAEGNKVPLTDAEMPTQDRDERAHSVPMDMTEEVSPTCDLCGDTFKNTVDLDAHIKSKHNEVMGEDSSSSQFPTKYHQLGSELISGMAGTDGETATSMDIDSEDSGLDQVTKDPVSGEITRASGRIFHMDAYCDICQKEFCNRYFLKTHKANKHGIYENGSGSGTPSTTPQPQSTTPPQAEALPLTSKSESPAPVKDTPPPLKVPEKPASSSSSKPDKASGKSDMEDYCEFCQKHFCNKYYLRKHKQDVHGLIVDTPPGRRGRPAGTGPLGGPANSLPITSGTPIQTIPQLPVSTCGVANPTISNVMFLNPFMPPVALIQAQPLLQANPHTLTQIPGLTTVPASVANLPGQGEAPGKDSNPTTTTSANDPKASEPASCDICHKEFCNRYFLNIHKANKHGIKIDDMPKPEGATVPVVKQEISSEEQAALMQEKAAKTAADVLAQHGQKVSQQMTNSAQLNTRSDSRGNSPTSGKGGTMFGNMIAARMADRVMCDICNKEVCNKYFLKTHKMKVHGIAPTALEQADRRKADFRAETTQKPNFIPVPENMDSVMRPRDDELLKMGIDPEAYCEICKKEFCSKYFLKTHKLNIHGIKVDNSSPVRPTAPPLPMMNIKREPSALDFKASVPPSSQGPQGVIQSSSQAPVNMSTGLLSQGQGKGSSQAPPLLTMASQMPILQPPAAVVPPMSAANINIITTPVNPNNPDTPVQHTWKWKEPSASQRVRCDLCNKELCNKYFLRTHKMNKHGIYEAWSPGMKNGSPTNPSTPSSMDGSSSELPPIEVKPMNGGDTPPTMSQGFSQALMQIKEQRRVQEQQEQQCNLCGLIFGEELELQLHMVQEHQGLVSVSAELPGVSYGPAHVSSRRIRKRYLHQLARKAGRKGMAGSKKRFRCMFCKKGFRSRLLCRGHIQEAHRQWPANSNGSKPNLPVAYATPTESEQGCTLQPFLVKVADNSNGSCLVPCMVHLPVHRQLDEPCTMTLTLNPVKP